MLAGFVLGGIVGTLVITHIASASLQFFWNSTQRPERMSAVGTCSDISGVRMEEEKTDTGSIMTSLVIGDGKETLLTVPRAQLRYIPSAELHEAYLTAVASQTQQEAFPAVSLYRIDYCAKTLTHLLGGGSEPRNILRLSDKGTWVAYMADDTFMLMHTDEGRALSSERFLGARLDIIPNDIAFSPREDAVALRYGGTSREIWFMGSRAEEPERVVAMPGSFLPAWSMLQSDEYLTNIQ